MRILALAAAASMSLAPTLAMAQQNTCPVNAVMEGDVCVCSSGFILGPGGACVAAGGSPDAVVAVDPGTTAGLPIFEEIPPGAIVVGGLVLLAGAIIGIAAASDDDDGTTTTTTTTTN
jgi:hypothetical protein